MYNSKKPFVSVVIPTLNEEKYLKKCLDSFKNQTYTSYEIIVSDGGSTDTTVRIAHEFNSIIVSTPGSTVVQARQRGVEIAKGSIIVGADADTLYPRDYIEKVVHHFIVHTDCIAVGGIGEFENHPRYLHFLWNFYYVLIRGIYQTTKFILYVPAFNLSFRKSAFLQIHGYTTYLDFGGDEIDFLRKLKSAGPVFFDPTLIVYPSSRRAKDGIVRLIFKHTIIDYYANLILAYLFKRPVIRGKPVR